MTKTIWQTLSATIFGVLSLGTAPAAIAAPSTYTAPEIKVLDPNGVDLVSGQYNRSDTFLTIGDPASGGLTWAYTGHPGTDSYTGEVWYTGSAPNLYWTVKIAGSTENISAVCENNDTGCRNQHSPNFFSDTGSAYTYTVSDGTVYSFKKLTEDQSSSQRRGILTSITRPNGDSVAITHEHDGCATYQCGYRIKNVVSNRGYALKYEYETTNFYRLETIKAVNRAETYCDDLINACSAYHSAITFDYPNGGTTFKITDAETNSTEYGVSYPDPLDTEVISYVKQADGWEVNATYDVFARITTLTNPEGTWKYTYSDNTRIDVDRLSDDRTVWVWDSNNVLVMSAVVRKNVMMPKSVTRPNAGTVTYDLEIITAPISDRKWGRVDEVIQPEGNKTVYTYDDRGNVRTITNKAKPGSGLADTQTMINYPGICPSPRTCNKPNWVRDAKGNYTNYTYESDHGGVTSVTLPSADGTSPTPKTITTYRNNFTAQIKASDAPGHMKNAGTVWLPDVSMTCATAVTCDGSVNQLKTITSYGTYNLQPTEIRTQAGDNSLSATITAKYDPIGNVVEVDGPLAGTIDRTLKFYDKNRRVTYEAGVDPDAELGLVRPMTRHIYDSMGREKQTESGTGTATGDPATTDFFTRRSYVVTQFNSRGLTEWVKNYNVGIPGPESITQFNYNNRGQVLCTALRMNKTVYSTITSTDACQLGPIGEAYGSDRITHNRYDQSGRLIEVKRAVDTLDKEQIYATYTFTKNGQKASESDARGNVTRFKYDGFDRLSATYYPNPSILDYTRQPCAATPETFTGDTGCATAQDYTLRSGAEAAPKLGAHSTRTDGGSDDCGTFSYPQDCESFRYDLNGNLTTWRRRDGSEILYGYDRLNRQTVKGGAPIADIGITYDLTGRITSKYFLGSGKSVAYAYDGLGRLSSTTDIFNRTVTYGYNAAGARTQMTLPTDGSYITYTLDNANRPISVNHSSNTSLFRLGYNSLGQRTRLDRGHGSAVTTYGYNASGQLTSFINDLYGPGSDSSLAFSYTPSGQIHTTTGATNVYDYKEKNAINDGRTYDGLNRDSTITALESNCTQPNAGYDCRGNLINDGVRKFTYDGENRLLSKTSTSDGLSNINLEYDPEGRLVKYRVGTTVTSFLYDGTDLIREYDNETTTIRRTYVHGPGDDEPIVWFEGAGASNKRFLIANQQGSIIATTNSVGDGVTVYKYGPYGEPKNVTNDDAWPLSIDGSRVRFAYTGQTMLPEAKLYYYKARVYDPVMGRFLQTDPIGSADNLNLYQYTHSDPVNGIDPTGTIFEENSLSDDATDGEFRWPWERPKEPESESGSERPAAPRCEDVPEGQSQNCTVIVGKKEKLCDAECSKRKKDNERFKELERAFLAKEFEYYYYDMYGKPQMTPEYAEMACLHYNAMMKTVEDIDDKSFLGALGLLLTSPSKISGGLLAVPGISLKVQSKTPPPPGCSKQ